MRRWDWNWCFVFYRTWTRTDGICTCSKWESELRIKATCSTLRVVVTVLNWLERHAHDTFSSSKIWKLQKHEVFQWIDSTDTTLPYAIHSNSYQNCYSESFVQENTREILITMQYLWDAIVYIYIYWWFPWLPFFWKNLRLFSYLVNCNYSTLASLHIGGLLQLHRESRCPKHFFGACGTLFFKCKVTCIDYLEDGASFGLSVFLLVAWEEHGSVTPFFQLVHLSSSETPIKAHLTCIPQPCHVAFEQFGHETLLHILIYIL